MAEPLSDRRLLVRSRLADGYQLTALGEKQVQHVFTVWFPRMVFYDLTDDTVAVEVIVRMGRASGKSLFKTSFLGGDGAVIKTVEYDEDRLVVGKPCESYDQRRSGYVGKKDGFDLRLLFYMAPPATISRRL
jgi:hypothetical protein